MRNTSPLLRTQINSIEYHFKSLSSWLFMVEITERYETVSSLFMELRFCAVLKMKFHVKKLLITFFDNLTEIFFNL